MFGELKSGPNKKSNANSWSVFPQTAINFDTSIKLSSSVNFVHLDPNRDRIKNLIQYSKLARQWISFSFLRSIFQNQSIFLILVLKYEFLNPIQDQIICWMWYLKSTTCKKNSILCNSLFKIPKLLVYLSPSSFSVREKCFHSGRN